MKNIELIGGPQDGHKCLFDPVQTIQVPRPGPFGSIVTAQYERIGETFKYRYVGDRCYTGDLTNNA